MDQEEQTARVVGSIAQQAASGVQQIIDQEFDTDVNTVVVVYQETSEGQPVAIGAATVSANPEEMRETTKKALEAAYQMVLSRPPDTMGRRGG